MHHAPSPDKRRGTPPLLPDATKLSHHPNKHLARNSEAHCGAVQPTRHSPRPHHESPPSSHPQAQPIPPPQPPPQAPARLPGSATSMIQRRPGATIMLVAEPGKVRRGGAATSHHPQSRPTQDHQHWAMPAPRRRATGVRLIKARADPSPHQAVTAPRLSAPLTRHVPSSVQSRTPVARRRGASRHHNKTYQTHPRFTDKDRDGWAGGLAMVPASPQNHTSGEKSTQWPNMTTTLKIIPADQLPNDRNETSRPYRTAKPPHPAQGLRNAGPCTAYAPIDPNDTALEPSGS